MPDYNSLVPMVANAAVAVSGNIASLVLNARASGVVQRTQLKMLKAQTAKVLTEARAYLAGDIVVTNLEQIGKTQEYIDTLVQQGKLHDASLDMAMEQLSVLNRLLRENLERFKNGEWW